MIKPMNWPITKLDNFLPQACYNVKELLTVSLKTMVTIQKMSNSYHVLLRLNLAKIIAHYLL